jgi:hypothetical protein
VSSNVPLHFPWGPQVSAKRQNSVTEGAAIWHCVAAEAKTHFSPIGQSLASVHEMPYAAPVLWSDWQVAVSTQRPVFSAL